MALKLPAMVSGIMKVVSSSSSMFTESPPICRLMPNAFMALPSSTLGQYLPVRHSGNCTANTTLTAKMASVLRKAVHLAQREGPTPVATAPASAMMIRIAGFMTRLQRPAIARQPTPAPG